MSINNSVVNIVPPKETIIEAGTGEKLTCEYNNPAIDSCNFYVYRIGKGKLGDKREWKYRGRKVKDGIFQTDEDFAPRFSWFKKDEEEIRATFDVSVISGARISCNHQVLVIKKGKILINLFWGEVTGDSKNQKIRIYAEYSKKAKIHSDFSNYVKEGNVEFPMDIAHPINKDYKHKLYDFNDTIIGSQPKGSKFGKDNNYVSFSESSKNENELIIIESKVIDLNLFFKYFAKVTLQSTIRGGFYVDNEDLKDISESKIFKRSFRYYPEEIFSFLEAKKFIPKPFKYRSYLEDFQLSLSEDKKIYERIKKGLDIANHVFDKKLGKWVKANYLGIAYKQAKALTIDIYNEFKASSFKYKYFKEELARAREEYQNDKNDRSGMLRTWFMKHNNGLTPEHPRFKKQYRDAEDEITLIVPRRDKEGRIIKSIHGKPIRRDSFTWSDFERSQISGVYREQILPLLKIEMKWRKEYIEHQKIELATVSFLEKAEKVALSFKV